ncbi:MAG: hypothetical protein JO362_22080 [Streptomycetaceae bacterium]|nr:hypothetical protein [Streptomycetaceae bacterium]
MPPSRGKQQRGKTAQFKPDRPIRAEVEFAPGDEPYRPAFEWLVHDMGVSGAQVLREAVMELWQKRAAQRGMTPEEAQQIAS